MVRAIIPSRFLPLPYTLSSLLTFDAGDVSTVCEIKHPTFVAVTANQTVLVSTWSANVLYKVTHEGTSTTLTQTRVHLN